MSFSQHYRRQSFILLAIILVSLFLYLQSNSVPSKSVKIPQTSNTLSSFGSNTDALRYAYATFLSTRVQNETEDDPYFTATRVLAYQLLHRPSTRTQFNLPFLVITPPYVSEHKRRVLTDEGATVIQVPQLNPTNWTPKPLLHRWVDQFTKLRLFELTNYNRILYMDSDMLLMRCLDAIFSEPEVVEPRWTKHASQTLQQRDAPMPQQYVFAGVAENNGPGNAHPAAVGSDSQLNGGFFVLQPSRTLFEHYEALLQTEGTFDSEFMEMALLNYAHRHDGPMPWVSLQPGRWNSNWPTLRDWQELGSATLHDKFWSKDNKDWIERELVEMWWRVQGQMEGFWMKEK